MFGGSRGIRVRAAAISSCALLALAPGISFAQSVAPDSVRPLYGNIGPFYGNIGPFYGNIGPFYGNIGPFYGNIGPFYGNIGPFWGDVSPFSQPPAAATDPAYKDNDPFWGSGPSNPYKASPTGIAYATIGPFWQAQSARWNTVNAAWANATTPSDAIAVANQIQTLLVNPAATFWGAAIAKGAPPAPGTSGGPKPKSTFQATYAALLGQAGIALNADGSINANSLLGVSQTQRAMLSLNMYDALMDYSGTGHVDWWMGQVNWTPALAITQGKTPTGGTSPTIGMLDAAVSSGTHLSKQLTQLGSTALNNGHGAAVGSLIMGSTDGSGILGVMPQGSVNVVVYDPYDATGTTNWTDVGTGIATLSNYIFKDKAVPVGVLNASLGVPGWTLNPGWNGALTGAGAAGHNLVIAAGNDGIAQTQNVPWNFATNPNILIVGSVGVDGTISNFSNQPGEACLLPTSSTSTVCSEANKLKYRFIVAPGELILVSDGQGGHVRQSGTSLAAPLVSGTIGLLQNRWPWLSKYPNETAQIILQSATPLGSQPGADPVYGVGELNVAASQSPLNFGNLTYYSAQNGKASTTATPVSTVFSQIRAGTQAAWDAAGLSYTAIERIGNTYRDFQIPLATKLIGQNVTTNAGGQLFQSYLTAALRAQASKFAMMAAAPDAASPMMGFSQSSVPAGSVAGLALRISISPRETTLGYRVDPNPYQADAALVGGASTLRFGYGQGAGALDGHAGFGFRSDYDISQGGANPLLGLASGGGYANGSVAVSPRLHLSIGTTQRRDVRNLAAFGLTNDATGLGVRTYSAQATHVAADYALARGLTLHGAVTQLHEGSAVLGIQSLDRADLANGATTDGATLGFDLAMRGGFSLTGSATLANTRSQGGQLATGPGGLTSTAAEIALTKSHLFSTRDKLRLTVATPMHIVGGGFRYSSVGVVDRNTGELGVVTQSYDPGAGRTPVSAELMYGGVLPKGAGQFSFFSRAGTGSDTLRSTSLEYTGGVQISLGF